MSSPRIKGYPSPPNGYIVAVVLTVGALVLTLWARPVVKLNSFNLFQGAVFISAWYGGLGPGILASVASIAFVDYFLISPYFRFSLEWIDDGLNLAVFAIVSIVTSSLSARLKRANAEIERAHDTLEQRVQERTAELLEAEKALLDISHREQQRMGQDLHDGLCQNLAGLQLLADVLNEKLAAQHSSEVAVVEKIEARLRDALAQADGVSRGLYPVELETNGLTAALREMAGHLSSTYSVACRFVSRRDILVSDGEVATHLFRIAQEAAMNAIKNGKTKTLTVRLFGWGGRLQLVIADRGAGFNPSTQRKGMGLKIMEYRARVINAAFAIRARKRGGILVSCALHDR